MSRKLTAVISGLGISALAAAGCGGDKSKPAATSAAGNTGNALTVRESEPAANRYAYQGLHGVTGGVLSISFANTGKVPHELQLVRVDAPHTQAELVAALTKLASAGPKGVPEPSWLHPAGGVGVTGPGANGKATLILPPGQYYALDTQSGHGDNAPSFFTQGAIAPFTVTGGAAGATLPATTARITTKDVPGDRHAFVVSGLSTGTVTLTFDNTSKEDHHINAALLLPGKTVADVKKLLAAPGGPSGPPPFDTSSETAAPVLAHKNKFVTQLTFAKPGNYALICFLRDRNGKGKPHFLKGMLKQITIR